MSTATSEEIQTLLQAVYQNYFNAPNFRKLDDFMWKLANINAGPTHQVCLFILSRTYSTDSCAHSAPEGEDVPWITWVGEEGGKIHLEKLKTLISTN